MTSRWPRFHRPALAWIERVERAIHAREPDAPGPYISITSAIQYQFEIGAHRETVRCLIGALAVFATSCGVEPSQIGLDRTADEILDRLQPRADKTR